MADAQRRIRKLRLDVGCPGGLLAVSADPGRLQITAVATRPGNWGHRHTDVTGRLKRPVCSAAKITDNYPCSCAQAALRRYIFVCDRLFMFLYIRFAPIVVKVRIKLSLTGVYIFFPPFIVVLFSFLPSIFRDLRCLPLT